MTNLLEEINKVLDQMRSPDNGGTNDLLISAVEATLNGHKPRTSGSTLQNYPIRLGDCEACTTSSPYDTPHVGIQGLIGLQSSYSPNGKNIKFPCPVVMKIAKAWGIQA